MEYIHIYKNIVDEIEKESMEYQNIELWIAIINNCNKNWKKNICVDRFNCHFINYLIIFLRIIFYLKSNSKKTKYFCHIITA